MSIYDYDKYGLRGTGLANSIYGLMIYPRTTSEVMKLVYGVAKTSDANITPVSNKRVEMDEAGFLERIDQKKLRNVKFKSKFEPFIYYLKKEMLKDSRLNLKDDYFNAILKILDSNWFREIFSNKYIYQTPDWECYRNHMVVSTRGNVKKIEFFKVFPQIGCFLGNIGIISNSISNLYHHLDYDDLISVEEIINSESFDDLIKNIDIDDERIIITQKYMDAVNEWKIPLPTFIELPNGYSVEGESKYTRVYPENFVKHLNFVPGIIPEELSNIFMRSGRLQLTILRFFCDPAVEELCEELSI